MFGKCPKLIDRVSKSGVLIYLLTHALGAPLSAGSERMIDYRYDQAAHLTKILSQTQSNPPDVTAIAPAFATIGLGVPIVASGVNLFGAQVTAPDPGLPITNVQSTVTEVGFDVRADNAVVLGHAALTFTTGLGSGRETIIVVAPVPDGLTVESMERRFAASLPVLCQQAVQRPAGWWRGT